MVEYFDKHRAIGARTADTAAVLATIAGRYMERHAARGMSFYAWHTDGIRLNTQFQYVFDFDQRFPDAEPESSIYAWSRIWSEEDTARPFEVYCHGPLIVYCNGERIYKPDVFTERHREVVGRFSMPLRAGWNSIVLRFICTKAGCGGLFGVPYGRYHPPDCVIASAEREGQKGWLFTLPLSEKLNEIPLSGTREEDTGVIWYPAGEWERDALAQGQMARLYGHREGCCALAYSRIAADRHGLYAFCGRHDGPVTVWLNRDIAYRARKSGEFSFEMELAPGNHPILVQSECGEADWGFTLCCRYNGQDIPFQCPADVRGTTERWLYAGPFPAAREFDPADLYDMERPMDSTDGRVFWRLDKPDTVVRPFNENPLYGHWSYSLGVTLYGLAETARLLQDADMLKYAVGHVYMCVRYFTLAMWERETYGFSCIHNHLTAMDSLDDCGAFGSLMLEVAGELRDNAFTGIAACIADFIMNGVNRLPDGAFYRAGMEYHQPEETLWADDLFMSVPFLCRYYRMTGDAAYIDEAAAQMVRYHRYLFLPEKRVMSHVYDHRHRSATGVAWGRGNGWVAFTYSEILAFIPRDHPFRDELQEFFNELCEGYLALQDDAGLWHQVLTDPQSYPEASCTAMFCCAFARGVRNGWLRDWGRYAKAVEKAWTGLCTHMIDSDGNIYGVCRGSGFSFSADYYKEDLGWILNDTHGIGIVLLAGVEYLRMVQMGLQA